MNIIQIGRGGARPEDVKKPKKKPGNPKP